MRVLFQSWCTLPPPLWLAWIADPERLSDRRKRVGSDSTGGRAGPAELIEDGVNGFLIPMNDEALYVKQLDRLLADAGVRCRFSEQARVSIGQVSQETVLARFEQLVSGAKS